MATFVGTQKELKTNVSTIDIGLISNFAVNILCAANGGKVIFPFTKKIIKNG